jgi:hypothetical protein
MRLGIRRQTNDRVQGWSGRDRVQDWSGRGVREGDTRAGPAYDVGSRETVHGKLSMHEEPIEMRVGTNRT